MPCQDTSKMILFNPNDLANGFPFTTAAHQTINREVQKAKQQLIPSLLIFISSPARQQRPQKEKNECQTTDTEMMHLTSSRSGNSGMLLNRSET